MEETASPSVTHPVHRGKSRRRRQLTILFTCVLIAIFLWFLRALENEYTTRVEHPVSYINLPDNLISLNPLPDRIYLEVRGLGFSILKHNWNFSKTPLTIDIRKLRAGQFQRLKGFEEVLPMNQQYNDFSGQLKDLRVLAIIPDTLVFRFALKKSHMIRVIPVLDYENRDYQDSGNMVSVEPDSVFVEGPDLIVDTLNTIKTDPIRISKNGALANRTITMENIHPLVKVNPKRVTVTTGIKSD